MSKKHKNRPKTWQEVISSMRQDWGGISPVTKVIPNKKETKKEKAVRSELNELY